MTFPRIGCSIAMTSLLIAGMGCASNVAPTTRPATDVDYHLGQSNYWMAKPVQASVNCRNFESLWQSAQYVTHADGFTIDREEFRNGVLTSRPLVSAQLFEPWRQDVGDFHGGVQSTVATVRRTVHFTIRKLPDGNYSASPKVLVERHSLAERRITSVSEYLDVFSVNRPLDQDFTEEGIPIVADYWYAIGRDNAMEAKLVEQLKAVLPNETCQE